MPLDRLADTATGPEPVVHPDTEPFWDALSQGELRIQLCARCGTHRYPFRARLLQLPVGGVQLGAG